MTDERWDKLDALAAAATPGPWDRWDTVSEGCSVVQRTPGRRRIARLTSGPLEVCQADAAFIAACDPATIRELVADAKERDELREALTGEDLRQAITAACSLANPRLSEVDWDDVGAALGLRKCLHPSGRITSNEDWIVCTACDERWPNQITRPPDELRRLSEAATPGPWVYQSPTDGEGPYPEFWIDTHAYADGPEPVVSYPLRGADAAFIVAAVNYVRSLEEPVSEGEEGT